MVPERHNAVKVLLFLDVGGSMDDHVRICEELFSAARAEFKHLEYFYFHNFLYESVWRTIRAGTPSASPPWRCSNLRARSQVVFVGDATMSPYEIVYPGGSVEHWNEEPGAVWMTRLLNVYPKAIWLNPEPQSRWSRTSSIEITRKIFEDRMFALTPEGIDAGMRAL